jgi:hypothetical protein
MEKAKAKVKDLVLDIGLTDVIYGVVFAYGFSYFDAITTRSGYLLFVFTYIVLIIDWLYTHHTYWGKNYKRIYLFLDLSILFIFSRLIRTSSLVSSQYLYWLAILFLGYVIWDYVMKLGKIEAGFNWLRTFTADSIGAVLFFSMAVLSSLGVIQITNLFVLLAVILIYVIILKQWFARAFKK